MRRKPRPLFSDPMERHVIGLRGLLGVLERHAAEHPPITFTPEALERAGFKVRLPATRSTDGAETPDE